MISSCDGSLWSTCKLGWVNWARRSGAGRQAGMRESTWNGIQNPNRSAFASGSSKLVGMLFWRWLQAKSGCKYKIAQLWLQEHSAALRTRRSSPAVEALAITCWLCTAGRCLQEGSGGSWLAWRWQHLQVGSGLSVQDFSFPQKGRTQADCVVLVNILVRCFWCVQAAPTRVKSL